MAKRKIAGVAFTAFKHVQHFAFCDEAHEVFSYITLNNT